jgi:N-acetylmuramoyl-L-alanine amidase
MTDKLLLILIFWLIPFTPALALVEIKPTPSMTGPWKGGTFRDTTFEGVRYISSQFLESLFGREGTWVPDRQKFVISDSTKKKWYFTLDNPYMNIGDDVFNLGFPVRRGPEFLYLPVPSLIRILERRGYPLQITESISSVPVEPKVATPSGPGQNGITTLHGIVAEERDNGTLVTVQATGKLEWESFWVAPHFILKLQGGHVGPQYPLKAQGRGLVKNILTLQEKDLVQVTLYIPKVIDTVEVTYSEEDKSYQILVHKKSNKPAPTQGTSAKDSDSKNQKAFGTIIIDPGHGGKDQGAQAAGVNEAQVTLAVAKELKTALAKMGFKALLTREDDRFVELKDRPKFASDEGGDLFVSLHCNSIAGTPKRKKTVTGFTAYILREGESEEDKTLARRENQAISEENDKNNKTEISPVEWILLEHQLNLYSKESESFIDQVVKEFEGFQIGKYSTGASQAGFYVLVGAYMPAVLFEMGFISHDEDRRIMASTKGQKQIAERMSKAIQKYRQNLTKKSQSDIGAKGKAK